MSTATASPAAVSTRIPKQRRGTELALLVFAYAIALAAFAQIDLVLLDELSSDFTAFAIVCVLSGLAFGADLALPASLLADVIDDDEGRDGRPDGAYFGLWHLLEKLALALAAGLALPLLQLLGYAPGAVAGAGSALPWVYALLPCAIKLAAALMLWLFAPESGRTKTFLTGEAP